MLAGCQAPGAKTITGFIVDRSWNRWWPVNCKLFPSVASHSLYRHAVPLISRLLRFPSSADILAEVPNRSLGLPVDSEEAVWGFLIAGPLGYEAQSGVQYHNKSLMV